MSKETFQSTVEDLEYIVVENSNCRDEKDIISCNSCPELEECQMHGYNDALKVMNEAGEDFTTKEQLAIRQEVKQNRR